MQMYKETLRITVFRLPVLPYYNVSDAGVPELIVQKRIGHRSLDALHMYERITPKEETAVAQILSAVLKKVQLRITRYRQCLLIPS